MAANKNNEVKPGWKSTEFWVTIVVALASLAWGAGVVDPAGDSVLIKLLDLYVPHLVL